MCSHVRYCKSTTSPKACHVDRIVSWVVVVLPWYLSLTDPFTSNSNYELEFCLAHTITTLCEYLTWYKVKKVTYFLRKTIEILSFLLFRVVEDRENFQNENCCPFTACRRRTSARTTWSYRCCDQSSRWRTHKSATSAVRVTLHKRVKGVVYQCFSCCTSSTLYWVSKPCPDRVSFSVLTVSGRCSFWATLVFCCSPQAGNRCRQQLQ